MIKGLLFFLLLCTPPAKGHINIDLTPEYDESYTAEVDPYSPKGLKVSYLSSVMIQSVSDGVPQGFGSGNYFKLGKHRFIITAAHVVNGDHDIKILERGFRMVTAKVVMVDNNTDIAILVPEERLKYTKPIPFRRDIVNQMGERVYHTGHPAREGWHISEGILSGTQNDVLLINTFAWPGSSGSVVFDETGRVVGVLSSIRMDGPFGIPELIEHIVLAGNIKTLSQETLKSVLSDGSN